MAAMAMRSQAPKRRAQQPPKAPPPADAEAATTTTATLSNFEHTAPITSRAQLSTPPLDTQSSAAPNAKPSENASQSADPLASHNTAENPSPTSPRGMPCNEDLSLTTEQPTSTLPCPAVASTPNGKDSAKAKKEKRLKSKALRAAANDPLACKVCGLRCETRSQLFKHIKKTGHAAPLST
uniref:C2H2-type domain-containing protein n=1 Tax=Chrysotila carterae TaxID=13221 RepID=A0A7S4BH84_CHRCT